MALKSKELCRRVRVSDGEVTYHVVSPEGKMREIGENAYRDFELGAARTDTFYGQNDAKFQRQFKTVYYV